MAINEETSVPTITLSDFKSWLQGVEDMQEAEWTPTPTQWSKIRSKINQIQEQNKNNVVNNQFVPKSAIEHAAPYIPPYIPPQVPPGARVSTFMPAVPGSSFEVNPKTPDIDTSSGTYTPPFV